MAEEKKEKTKKPAAKTKKKAGKKQTKIQKIGNDANRSLSKYLQEIGKLVPLDPNREVELAIAVKKGSRRALTELITTGAYQSIDISNMSVERVLGKEARTEPYVL